MASQPEPKKDLADRLMAALQRDEFVLYTQTIAPLDPQPENRAIQEIFVRFKEEDDKLLPPGTFFSVLEECRLLPYLDRWVVNRLARWVRAALGIRSDWSIPCNNVNLSDATLVDPDFGRYVCQYVDDSFLSDGALGFEIAFDSAMAHQDALQHLMAQLRPHGCSLTLAGFDGTEPAFAALKTFAPNFVKISVASVDPAKVSEINRRCHSLGSKTIAEQVENSRVLDHLRRSKTDFVQGFGISPVQPL